MGSEKWGGVVTRRSRLLLGIGLISLATLSYETLLIRILSVTLWYHYAFLVVSIAMLGMGIGGTVISFVDSRKTWNINECLLTRLSSGFAISIPLSLGAYLRIPLFHDPAMDTIYFFLSYIVLSFPFILSGAAICLAFSLDSRLTGQLYASNLGGSAMGCLIVAGLLKLTDGPNAMLVVSCIAGVGAWLVAGPNVAKESRRTGRVTALGLLVLAICQFSAARAGHSFFKITWVKGWHEYPALYEAWNSISRLRVIGDPTGQDVPFGWGLSRKMPKSFKANAVMLLIDARAGTPITQFDGDLRAHEYLKYDVVNMAHFLRPNANTLVVGVGGGRDVLSALVFRQPRIDGLEINQAVLDTLEKPFGEYSGHLERRLEVRLINEDARSYVERSRESYDLIQISLVDTFASSGSGALVLSENSLYTVEAWAAFIRRLRPGGVLTVSRTYHAAQPYEMYRLAALANAALLGSGSPNPRLQVYIVTMLPELENGVQPDGTGTLLLSNRAFTPDDLRQLDTTAKRLGFGAMLTPSKAMDSVFERIVSGQEGVVFAEHFAARIEAPTDDRPFFFYFGRAVDLIRGKGSWRGVDYPVILLVYKLLVGLGILAVLAIVVSGWGVIGKVSLDLLLPRACYVGAIGMGYMAIEISQIQRLVVFLGNPAYGFTVVLFTLLLASGCGSWSTKYFKSGQSRRGLLFGIPLLVVLCGYGLASPTVLSFIREQEEVSRIGMTILILFPLGYFLGMPFPMAMRAGVVSRDRTLPWLWSINASVSVFSSVLAYVVALELGITPLFWMGVGSYVIAVIVGMRITWD